MASLLDLKKKLADFFNQAGTSVNNSVVKLGQSSFGKGLVNTDKALRSAPGILSSNIKLAATNPRFAQQLPRMIGQGLTDATTQVYGNNLLSKTLNTAIVPIAENAAGGLSTPFTKKSVLQKGGDILKGVGSVAMPGQALAGGTLSGGLNAAGNLVGGKPLNNNFSQSFRGGFDFGAQLGPISKGVNLVGAPLLSRISGNVANQATKLPLVGNYSSGIGRIAAGGVEQGLTGTAFGLSQGQNPVEALKTGASLVPYGLLSGSKPVENKMNLYNVERVQKWQPAFKAMQDTKVSDKIMQTIDRIETIKKMGGSTKQFHGVMDEAAQMFLPKEAQNIPIEEQIQVWKYIANRMNGLSTPGEVPKVLKEVDWMDKPKSLGLGFVGKNDVGQPLSTPRVPQTFKTEKFNVGDKEVGIIKNIQKTLKLESRTVRSFDEMKAVAEEIGTSPKQLLKDIQTGRITDSEIIALGNTISTSSQRIQKLTNALKKNPGDAKIAGQLSAEEELINQAIRKIIKGGTEAGRSVAAFRVIANRNLDPTYWLDKAKRQLGDNKELNADVVTAINGFIKNKDRLGLASFISKLGESSGLEKAVGFWKASLLTGLRTHEANIVGNTAMGILETIKDIPATGFDIARSAITGSPRTKSIGFSTITDQFKGAYQEAKFAKEVLKTGVDPADIAKAELYKPLRYGNSLLGKAAQKMTDAVFRTLGAEDKVFYGAAYNKSIGEQLRLSKINGNAVIKPTEEMIKIATKDALYATFTNENALNNAIKAAKQAGGKEVAAAIDLVAPFTRTPTNVAKATFIDYTPVGIVKTVVQKVLNKGEVDNKALAEAFGRSLTGTGALWLGSELAKKGLISGPSSNKETERAQAELEGKTPNSVFLNGKWQSISKISPFGNLILLGAEYQKSGGDLAKTAFAGVKGFSENSFLQGLSNASKAVNEPDKFASSFFENAVAGFIPTLSSDIARGLDNVKRKPEGFVEKIQNRVPGFREMLPVRLNSKGEAVPEQGSFLSKVANPFNPSKPSTDSITQEMSRVGYNLNYTGDTISIDGVDTKLSRDQEMEYQKLAGKYINKNIPNLISSESYLNLPKDSQRDVIEKIVNASKTQAREELKTKLNTIKSAGGMKAEAAGIDNNTSNIVYLDGTSVKTIDLSPPTKGQGIGEFVNQNWNITKAREVWNAKIDQKQKDQAIKKLGLDPQDVRYDTLANYNNDIKTQYLLSKSQSKEDLIRNIATGRVVSIGDNVFAANGVIDNLVEQGILTKSEGKEFKNMKLDRNGKQIGNVSGGRGLKKLSLPRATRSNIPKISKLQSRRMPIVKFRSAPKGKTVATAKFTKYVAPTFTNTLTNKARKLYS